jgi:hypothetical protein
MGLSANERKVEGVSQGVADGEEERHESLKKLDSHWRTE